MTCREKQINIRVEPELLGQIDEFLEDLQKRLPAQDWTRSSAVRQALYEHFRKEETCSAANDASKS